MDPLELAVDAIAAHRLTRLVTTDSITRRPRRALIELAYLRANGYAPTPVDGDTWDDIVDDDPHPPPLAKLLRCRWCMGVWCAAGVTVARRVAPRSWPRLARLLVVADAAALIATLEED